LNVGLHLSEIKSKETTGLAMRDGWTRIKKQAEAAEKPRLVVAACRQTAAIFWKIEWSGFLPKAATSVFHRFQADKFQPSGFAAIRKIPAFQSVFICIHPWSRLVFDLG
jgi:hypothetical protein